MIISRPRDRALAAAAESRDMMSEALLRNNKDLMYRAVKLLEQHLRTAPVAADFRMNGLTLVHFKLLTGDMKQVLQAFTLFLNILDILVETDGSRLEVVELQPNHKQLFSQTVSNVLSHIDQPVYLECGNEGRRVGAEVVRAGGEEVVVTAGRDVDHRRHVELLHRLPQRPPIVVEQWRTIPVTATRIGVHVAADEVHLLDAAAQLTHRPFDRSARRLRKLAHRREVRRVEVTHSPDQLVLMLRPEGRGVFVADVVSHPAGPR